ncbi:uncharacterized protein LOC131434328 [Malaya genurostris]|uniref:uncharacterized protein LOC131434328 n=1 Tax=Malaya genurostris TaxID=325434 RepID=UPI0026F40373|nr:uncharacterized protein LOC131434328 [Malaya genurostris]
MSSDEGNLGEDDDKPRDEERLDEYPDSDTSEMDIPAPPLEKPPIRQKVYQDDGSDGPVVTENLFGVGSSDHAVDDEEADFDDAVKNVVDEQALTLAHVIASFDDYCLPRKNIAMEAFKFNTIAQKERQTFSEFETELRTQIQYCEFKCQQCQTSYADRMLRDRIIIGIQDKKLQLKLLDGRDDPLSKIVETCKVFEAASENKLILDRKVSLLEVKSVGKQPDDERRDVVSITKKQCYNCGKPFNHFSKCCRRKERKDMKPSVTTGIQDKQKSVLSINWSDAE